MLLEGNLQGIQHLGIPVTNLEKSKAFYLNFGFTEILRTAIPAQNTDAINVAMLHKDNLTVELYQLDRDACKQIASRRDGHIDHIALNVLDIDRAYADIRAVGLTILEDNAPVYLPFWENGVKFFTIRGPDGEKIEFNQVLT